MDASSLPKMLKKYIILFGIIALFLVPIQVLTVKTDTQTNYMFRIKDGEVFSIKWVHSVEEEEWEEFFIPKDGSIYLDSTRFKTFGAGVPSHAGKSSYLKDGWVYMVDIDRFIGQLFVQAGYNTNHQLIINGHMYTLSHPKSDQVYNFNVEDYPLYKYIYLFVFSKS